MPAVQRPDASPRLLSLLLVALLHALLLFAVLHFMVVAPKSSAVSAPERLLEMIIDTSRKAAPLPAPAAPRAKPTPRRGGVTTGLMPSYAPPVAPPDVTGLGQALFGCAPENPTLTPEQRAHCTNALGGGFTRPDDNALVEPKSHVKDPARREAEMRTKNTPGRIPCTEIISGHTGGGDVPVPGADPVCVLGGLINGFGPLNGLDK